MIFEGAGILRDRVEEITGRKLYSPPVIKENTTNFFSVVSGDVLRLAGHDYFVTGNAYEGRFGMDDDPKFWVKYAFDLTTGEKKIIKLVCDEEFSMRLGFFLIKAKRSAKKEADFLDVVKGHRNFMQGFSVNDSAGNLVRIIELIRGKSLFNHILDSKIEHEQYYRTQLPDILANLIDSIEGLFHASVKGTHHGDIRNDHLFIETDTGTYRWIDFDYWVNYPDYDIWCMGNLIIFTTAQGLLLHKDIIHNPDKYPLATGDIGPDDCSLYHKSRIANVKKVYPYVSKKLNDICLRYSTGGISLYDDYVSLIQDLKEVQNELSI